MRIPTAAIEYSEHGYVRFKCNAANIRCSFARRPVKTHFTGSVNTGNDKPFITYIGGFKFLPGMLDQRPKRLKLKLKAGSKNDFQLMVSPSSNANCFSQPSAIGELLRMPSVEQNGLPTSTLSELHWRICSDVRNKKKTALEPSRVRLIRNARLLAVTFCRAQAECSRCFQQLREVSNSKQENTKKL